MLCCFFSSLKCSESVQYFQFDSDGNMYVFRPGSGFSGPSIKVDPGFQMEECSQDELFSQIGESEMDSFIGTSGFLSQISVMSDKCESQMVKDKSNRRLELFICLVIS